MTVKINLLPEEYSNKKKAVSFNLKHIMLIVSGLVFAVLFIGYIILGLFKVASFEDDYEKLKVNRDVLLIQNKKMSNELARLEGAKKILETSIAILNKDLPILEFLRQVELSMPDGLWLKSLKVDSSGVNLIGYSYNENDIVLFATGLFKSNYVSQVGFPNIKRITKDGQSLVEFRLSCSLNKDGSGKEVSR